MVNNEDMKCILALIRAELIIYTKRVKNPIVASNLSTVPDIDNLQKIIERTILHMLFTLL